MGTDKQTAIRQIDEVISQFELTRSQLGAEISHRSITRLRSVINRFAPLSSQYVAEERKATNEYQLLGVLKALRDDIDADYLYSYRELINSDLCSDFLEMAEYLLQDENLKQPAAVLAGGVLEEHLRNLCEKSTISTQLNNRPKKADSMNADLSKTGAYGKNEQKQVTAWLGIRNSAAHAQYDEFNDGQVHLMITGLRDFISRFPA